MEQDRLREDIRTHSGAVAPSAVDLGQEEQCRLEPPNGARLGVAAPTYPKLTQRRRNAGIKTLTRVELERDSGFPGPGGQLLREETQFKPDPCEDALPKTFDPDHRGRLRAGADLVP